MFDGFYVQGYICLFGLCWRLYVISCYKFLWNILTLLKVKETFFDYREFARSWPLRCSDDVSVVGGSLVQLLCVTIL